MARILVVDDERNMRTTLALLLREEGHVVEEAPDAFAAIDLISNGAYHVVLTDLKMNRGDGMRVLEHVQESAPGTEVIIMTGYGTIESAVAAMRQGAFDYIEKPFRDDALLTKIDKALSHTTLPLSDSSPPLTELRERYAVSEIVGDSAPIRALLSRVVRIAPTDATVLITGESGTGKELVARAIHANSLRADRPFVSVNCAAITETLLESELFGHAKGAFTGAAIQRRGMLEEADGATFFFDEISETPTSVQAKLLRAIQEGEIRRLGENRPVKVDIRIIAATNRDLRSAIAEKTFREDLYYRLNVGRFRIPALRERLEDVPLLVHHFLGRYAEKMNRTNPRIDPAALDFMRSYEYPGNIRELENMIAQGLALSPDGIVRYEDVIPSEPQLNQAETDGARILQDVVDEAERDAIVRALSEVSGNREQAAVRLGLSATTLWRKMKRLGIS